VLSCRHLAESVHKPRPAAHLLPIPEPVIPLHVSPGLVKKPMMPFSRRVGALVVKVGMTQDWDEYGRLTPLTVLWLDENIITDVKTEDKHGYVALQVGAGSKKEKQLSPGLAGNYKAKNLPLKRTLAEFRVTADALLPLGTPITASHFLPGQYVDVTGTSLGKGFQGAVKLHGFKGQSASHGNTKSHRKLGSTGNRKTPARTYPGKKMPGKMGNNTVQQENLLVFKVDPTRNLLWVKGQVPGHSGNILKIRDSRKGQLYSQLDGSSQGLKYSQMRQLPLPTFTDNELPPAEAVKTDPKFHGEYKTSFLGKSYMYARSRNRR